MTKTSWNRCLVSVEHRMSRKGLMLWNDSGSVIHIDIISCDLLFVLIQIWYLYGVGMQILSNCMFKWFSIYKKKKTFTPKKIERNPNQRSAFLYLLIPHTKNNISWIYLYEFELLSGDTSFPFGVFACQT